MKKVTKLGVALCASLMAMPSFAKQFDNNQCIIVLASLKDMDHVKKYAKNKKNIRIFKNTRDLFLVADGSKMLDIANYEAETQKLRDAKKIPQDAFCTSGKTFTKEIDFSGKELKGWEKRLAKKSSKKEDKGDAKKAEEAKKKAEAAKKDAKAPKLDAKAQKAVAGLNKSFATYKQKKIAQVKAFEAANKSLNTFYKTPSKENAVKHITEFKKLANAEKNLVASYRSIAKTVKEDKALAPVNSKGQLTKILATEKAYNEKAIKGMTAIQTKFCKHEKVNCNAKPKAKKK